MLSHLSVTRYFHELRKGDAEAAQQLWEHYSRRLVKVAARSLGREPCVVADKEDIVTSAFASLCRRARDGQFSVVEDRHDLWHLLVLITERKAVSQVRHEGRLKRGRGRVVTETDLVAGGAIDGGGLDDLASPEPSPEMAAAMRDSIDALLGLLDAEQRSIALLKLEGFSNAQIATQIGRAIPTVERRLRVVRALWRQEEKVDEASSAE